MAIDRILYSTRADASSGPAPRVAVADGGFELALSTPRELGGAGGAGTNPEQLFAAGYAACFLGALRYVAGRRHIALPDATTVEAEAGIGAIPAGFGLQAALTVSAPGLAGDVLHALVEQAHQVCPFSNATRGNIDVRLSIAA